MSATNLRPTPDKKAIAAIRRLIYKLPWPWKPDRCTRNLSELHDLIPSYSNQCFWDPTRNSSISIDEGDVLLPFIPLYLDEFHNKHEREVVCEKKRQGLRAHTARCPVGDLAPRSSKGFFAPGRHYGILHREL
jgi:hypothetical protein